MDRLEKEYSVRPFQPGDEEGIVELLELVFDGWPRFGLLCSPLEHWKWKYLNNPLWKNQIIVGVSDHRIISCVHYPSLRIKIGHRVCLGTQGLDLRKQPMKYGFFYEYGGYLVKLENKYRNTLRPDRPSSYDFHVVEMTHFDERMEGFWGEIREHYSFIIERSKG